MCRYWSVFSYSRQPLLILMGEKKESKLTQGISLESKCCFWFDSCQAGAIRLMSVLVSEKLMAGPNTHYFTTRSPESGWGAKLPLVSCSYMQGVKAFFVLFYFNTVWVQNVWKRNKIDKMWNRNVKGVLRKKIHVVSFQ